MILITAVGLLVCVVWAIRAQLRGDHHIAARLAFTISLICAGSLVYETRNLILALGLALWMFAIAVAKKRFQAPRP